MHAAKRQCSARREARGCGSAQRPGASDAAAREVLAHLARDVLAEGHADALAEDVVGLVVLVAVARVHADPGGGRGGGEHGAVVAFGVDPFGGRDQRPGRGPRPPSPAGRRPRRSRTAP